MKQSPAGFYGFWASTPPLVAIGVSLVITAMLWFGAIKAQLLPDHWTIPARSDLLSDVGSFVDGHNNWNQPYNFLSKKNILIPLVCDPILPRVNRCLEQDGFYPSSYANAPLTILYFQSSGEGGFGRHSIIAQIESPSGVILDFSTRKKDLEFAAAQSKIYDSGPFGWSSTAIFSIFALTMWAGAAVSIYAKLRG
jgi:hypothetical protein